GGGRVYVLAGQSFDYAAWLDGFRKGRSFASNGPAISLKVDDKQPGDEIRMDAARDVTVQANVTSQVPLDTVDVLVNGRTVYSVPGGKTSIDFTHRVKIEGSAWIALRALGPRHRLVLNDTMAFAHTSPVYVAVAGRPLRVQDDIRFYREWVERLIARTEKGGRFATPEHKAEVLAFLHKGLAYYKE
ncbi:MAG: CehA/McbA family metallohydrolase, partial [Bryobacteraceae bacterium]